LACCSSAALHSPPSSRLASPFGRAGTAAASDGSGNSTDRSPLYAGATWRPLPMRSISAPVSRSGGHVVTSWATRLTVDWRQQGSSELGASAAAPITNQVKAALQLSEQVKMRCYVLVPQMCPAESHARLVWPVPYQLLRQGRTDRANRHKWPQGPGPLLSPRDH
jgi:hypothetical protein